jgi:HAD superfamily hydrolase (TIGR01509 family)
MAAVTPGLVIFDCDGVLVDSEVIAMRIFHECLVRAGFLATPEDALKLGLGRSAALLSDAVEAHFGRKLPADFIETMRAHTLRAFDSELRPIAGAGELLARFPLPRCVASNSHERRIRHALTVTGLIGFVEPHIFSAMMVARGKPAPDLFLLAAQRLGVAPCDCLVVEDSAHGVAAARAAGMAVVGFCGGGHCLEGHSRHLLEVGCARVFATMAELGEFLGVKN